MAVHLRHVERHPERSQPLDTFTLIVNWGDGSVLQTNAFPAGGGAFSLMHPYVLSNTNLLVQFTLLDDDTGTTTGTADLQLKSNPARPVLSIAPLPNKNFLLTISGTPGATYRVAVSSNLTTWTVLPGSEQTADTNGSILFEDTPLPPKRNGSIAASGPDRFTAHSNGTEWQTAPCSVGAGGFCKLDKGVARRRRSVTTTTFFLCT